MIASLDGYIADEQGNFDWAAPDAEVHKFVNHLEGPITTYLYGRRMYDVMKVWQTMDAQPDEPSEIYEFAEIWQAADKIVYSHTLDQVSTPKTRLERNFDAEAVAQLKESSKSDLSVGGPHLAAHAIRAGLVDEFQLFVVPHMIGGGTHWLPKGVKQKLELLDERRFRSGTVYLRYRLA